MLTRQLAPGLFQVDAQRLGDAFVDMPSPASHDAQRADERNRPLRETQRRIRNEQVGIERVACAQAVALGANSLRRIETEKLRTWGLVALVAVSTCIMRRKH